MSVLSIPKLFTFSRVKVDITFEDQPGEAVTARIVPDKRFRPVCGVCGRPALGVHSHHHSRTVRDLPLGSYRNVYLLVNYRKVECGHCGGFHVEGLDMVDIGGPRVTKRMARYVYELCKLMTVQDVATHLGLHWGTVKAIDKQFLAEEFTDTDYSGLGYLAIDEIAYKKGHNYLTVVMNFQTGRVVWVGKGRSADTLDDFFSKMPKIVREEIMAVAMDMCQPFIKAVSRWCPQANIVFDPFHVIAKYHEVIDNVRRAEMREATTLAQKKVVKGSRWILLKNEKDLTDKERPQLEELLKVNENLYKVYVLRDDLKELWKSRNRKDMAKDLDVWCERALQAKIPDLNKFVATLRRYRDGILNHAKHPIHNGRLEGMNNKIKVIKREAYGYRDIDYFKLKIKQRCSGAA